MTGWEIFVAAVESCSTLLIGRLLLVCIAGLIRELAGREHREGE